MRRLLEGLERVYVRRFQQGGDQLRAERKQETDPEFFIISAMNRTARILRGHHAPHRLACLKCPMDVPKEAARLIEARDGVLRLMQKVPLTEEEKSVTEGDVEALTRYIDGRKHVPPR